MEKRHTNKYNSSHIFKARSLTFQLWKWICLIVRWTPYVQFIYDLKNALRFRRQLNSIANVHNFIYCSFKLFCLNALAHHARSYSVSLMLSLCRWWHQINHSHIIHSCDRMMYIHSRSMCFCFLSFCFWEDSFSIQIVTKSLINFHTELTYHWCTTRKQLIIPHNRQ